MEEKQVLVCGGSEEQSALKRVIQKSRDGEQEIVVSMNQVEKAVDKGSSKKLAALSMLMVNTMNYLEPYYDILNPPKRKPHYFEYSGIPSEEQIRKRAERKARKKAKKEQKRGKKS